MKLNRCYWFGLFGALFLWINDASAQQGGYGYGHMWGMMNGWGWFGGVFMIIFWIAVIVAVIFLVRSLIQGRGGPGETSQQSALEILKERYARGEINKQEFEEKKKDILS